jgi:hypothetical protein
VQAPQIDGPARAWQSVPGLNCSLIEDGVIISSSDTYDALESLILELNRNDSPRSVRNETCVVSSDHSTGSDWFDEGVAPEIVPDEDWLEANNAAASAYTVLTTKPSCLRRGLGKATRHSRGRLRTRILEDASISSGRQSSR